MSARYSVSESYDAARRQLMQLRKQIKTFKGDRRSKTYRDMNTKLKRVLQTVKELHQDESSFVRVDYTIKFRTRNLDTGNIHTFNLTRSDILPNTVDAIKKAKRNAMRDIEESIMDYSASSPYNTSAAAVRRLIDEYRGLIMDGQDPTTVMRKRLPIFNGPNQTRPFTFDARLVALPPGQRYQVGPMINTHRTPKSSPIFGPNGIPESMADLFNQINVDAADAPNIIGMRSVESGAYGCAVEFVYECCAGTIPRETIFSKLNASLPGDDEFAKLVESSSVNDFVDDNVDFPETDCIQLGVKFQQILEFLNEHAWQTKVYFWFPLQSKPIISSHPNHKDRNYKSIAAYCKNNHIYVGDSLKRPKTEEVAPTLIKPDRFSLEYTDIFKNIKAMRAVNYHVDLTECEDSHNLNPLILSIYRTHRMLPQVTVQNGEIIKVNYGSVQVSTANDVDMRRELFNLIVSRYPDTAKVLKFDLQTFSQLVCMLYENYVGSLSETESTDSMHARMIYRTYTTHAVIGRYSEQKPTHCIDLNACYLTILDELGSKNPMIGLFDSSCMFETFDPQDEIREQHEYLVDKMIIHGIPLDAMVWNGHALMELIEQGIDITSQVKMVRKPTRFYRTTHIYKFIQHLRAEYAPYLKKLYTCFVGLFGKHCKKNQVGELTTDEAFYTDMLLAGNKGVPLSDKTENKSPLYLIHRTHETQQPNNNGPMYRYVLCQGVLKLLNLVRFARELGCEIVATRTDCVSVVKPDGFTPDQEAQIKTFCKFEKKPLKLVFKADHKPREYDQNLVDSFKLLLNQDNTQVQAIGGAGKSYNMNELIKQHLEANPKAVVVCAAPTNVVREKMDEDNNKTQKRIMSFTLDKLRIMFRNPSNRKLPRWVDNVSLFCIDEFSMMSDINHDVISYFLFKNPKMRLHICGDYQQIPSVEAISYDHTSSFAKFHFANHTELQYRPGTRYDEEYYQTVKHLIETRQISPALRNNIKPIKACLQNKDALNVSFTNVMREKIVTTKRELSVNNPEVMIIKRTTATLPDGTKKTFQNGTCIPAELAVAYKIPKSHYQSKLCTTADRSQSKTYTESFTVYEADRMSFQRIYTALTRPKTKAQVSIAVNVPDNASEEDFKNAVDDLLNKTYELHYDVLRSAREEFPVEVHIKMNQTGLVYLIRDDVKKLLYVGKTTQTLEERFAQECDPFMTHLDEPWDLKTAVASTLAICPVGLLEALETSYIAEYAGVAQTEGYKLCNKYKLPKAQSQETPQKTPQESQETPQEESQEESPLQTFYDRIKQRKLKPITIADNQNKWKIRCRSKNFEFEKALTYNTENRIQKLKDLIQLVSTAIREKLDAEF